MTEMLYFTQKQNTTTQIREAIKQEHFIRRNNYFKYI